MASTKKRYNPNERTDIHVNENGILCEVVDFGNREVDYEINGITEHIIFGIYFSFSSDKSGYGY